LEFAFFFAVFFFVDVPLEVDAELVAFSVALAFLADFDFFFVDLAGSDAVPESRSFR